MSKEEKLEKITMLLIDMTDPMFKYFDIDSDKLLDEKIEVMEALLEGKNIEDIPKYYDIFELAGDTIQL